MHILIIFITTVIGTIEEQNSMFLAVQTNPDGSVSGGVIYVRQNFSKEDIFNVNYEG